MFFHYFKLLWDKAKKLRLCKKDKTKQTKILIFILKIIHYMMIDDRKEFDDKMEEFYSQNKDC